MLPGKGAQIARSAGAPRRRCWRAKAPTRRFACARVKSARSTSTAARPSAKSQRRAQLRQYGKAGAIRWKGIRPTVRGVAMNPVDHPHGGGEGRTGEGQAPVSPWNTLTKGYRTRQQQAHADDDRRAPQEVRARPWHAQSRRAPSWTTTCSARSMQGGCHQGQEAHQDLVAPFDDPARFHRSDDRRAQRQAARSRVTCPTRWSATSSANSR